MTSGGTGVDEARQSVGTLPLFAGIDVRELTITRLGGLTNRVYRIDRGSYGDVKLDGLSTAGMRRTRRARRPVYRSARKSCISMKVRA